MLTGIVMGCVLTLVAIMLLFFIWMAYDDWKYNLTKDYMHRSDIYELIDRRIDDRCVLKKKPTPKSEGTKCSVNAKH